MKSVIALLNNFLADNNYTEQFYARLMAINDGFTRNGAVERTIKAGVLMSQLMDLCGVSSLNVFALSQFENIEDETEEERVLLHRLSDEFDKLCWLHVEIESMKGNKLTPLTDEERNA